MDNSITIDEVVALLRELKTELQDKPRDIKSALPVPSFQIYGDGSIRLKRSDTEYMCPTIWPPFSAQMVRDVFDMVLSRGRALVVDDNVQLGESLVLGVNCRYVDR